MADNRWQWTEHHKDCEWCGKYFVSNRFHAKTCSPSCRKALSRLPKTYDKKIAQLHELLDWVSKNKGFIERETWERDLTSISKRANNITYT